MRLSHRFEEALVMAARLHAGQRRKASEVPYLAHLLGVASLALEYGADEDEAIAALLHDAVEDQGGEATRALIERDFGARVAGIVAACSDAQTLPKPPWKARKLAHLARLRDADSSVRLVLAADKLHNSRALIVDYRRWGDALWQHFNGGKSGTLWYYRAMLAALAARGPTPLVIEFERAVSELEALVDGRTQAGMANAPADAEPKT